MNTILKFKLSIMVGVALLITCGSRADNPPPCTCDCNPYEGSGQYVRQPAVYTQSYSSPSDPGNSSGINGWVGTNIFRIAMVTDIGGSENLNYYGEVISYSTNVSSFFWVRGYYQDSYSRDWIWSGPPGTDPGAKGAYSVSGLLQLSIAAGNTNTRPNTIVESQASADVFAGASQSSLNGNSICPYGVNASIEGANVYAANTDTGSSAYAGTPGDLVYNWVSYGPGYTNAYRNAAYAGNGATIYMSLPDCVPPGSLGFSGEAVWYAGFGMSLSAQNDDPNSYVIAAAEAHSHAQIILTLSMSRCDN